MCVNIYDSYKSQLAMANEQFEPQTVEIQVARVCVCMARARRLSN